MAEHLSSAGGRLCWDHTSDADHAAGLFKMAVNDTNEISFGAMTGQIKSYGKIELTNSGGVSQVRVNGNLSRGFDTGCKNKNTKWVEGIFHDILKEAGVPLMNICIEDVPEERASDQIALYKQLTEKIKK